jgi:hypothetical protein
VQPPRRVTLDAAGLEITMCFSALSVRDAKVLSLFLTMSYEASSGVGFDDSK